MSSEPTPARQLASFIAKFMPSIAKEGRSAHARMRKLIPGATELVYDNWNGLVVGFGPTERPSEAVVSILMTADHITLCFIQNGPSLPDPQRLLKGSGNVVRHMRLSSARDLDTPPVRALIKAAVKLSDVPFARGKGRELIVKAISPRQRPRRPL
jgi:hypothetical protein